MAITTWHDPRAIVVQATVHPTPPPPAADGQDTATRMMQSDGFRSARVGRLRAPATPKGRLRVAMHGAHATFAEEGLRAPAFRAACKLPVPKRQAQVLDLKVLLHQEYGITYTDMVIQYRGVAVADFEVLSALPDWSVTPTLELLVLPGSHQQGLDLAKRTASRDLGWAQLLAHVSHSAHHEDWIERQALVELDFRRANGLLPLHPGESGGLAEQLRAEHRMDTLLSEFGAAAASVVRVVGQYPCPLQATESVELSERYGAGLKFVANGIVLRRLTSGLAIAQSLDVCESMRQAPKVAAASQRAGGACRGRVDRLCVPLSVLVEFLGVRWEATAVVPCGELAYGTYTNGDAEPLRQLPQAADAVETLAKAFDVPARHPADSPEDVGMEGMNAAARRGLSPRDAADAVAPPPLPRSTRMFLADGSPGVAGYKTETLWDLYLLAAPELLPPLPLRRRDKSGPITAWNTGPDTAVVTQNAGTCRPEFVFGPRASIPPATVTPPVYFDPRAASDWTPPMPMRRCARTHETITTFEFWTRRQDGDGPCPTVAMSEEGLAATLRDAVSNSGKSDIDPAALRDSMFQRVSYLHDGAYCRLPCLVDGMPVEVAARLHAQSAVQLLATHLERADAPIMASGGQLAATVHEFGVAIRQLGRVAERANLRHVKETLLCEMVARAMRDIIHARLRRTEYNDVQFGKKIIAQALNDLFSKVVPPTDSAVERRIELVKEMTKKFDVDVAASISEHIHSALLLQRVGELIGLVLQERPETYDLDQLTPFSVDDIADLLPRVPTAGVGMRVAVKKDPKSDVGEDGNKKKVDPFKTLCVAVAGGRVSWWMGQAMLRFAARLDALGQRSVWYLPGGPGRDWATERYREAAALAMGMARGDKKLTKRQRQAGKRDKVEHVSMLSCQLVRACAANTYERHCSENGAPERSRWDHAAGTDLEARLAQESADQWRWLFSIAAVAVGYGASMADARFAAGPGHGLSNSTKEAIAQYTSNESDETKPGMEVTSNQAMWGATMRAEALEPEPEEGPMASAARRRMSIGTMMATDTARRISESGLAGGRQLDLNGEGGEAEPEVQILAGLSLEQQELLNMSTVHDVHGDTDSDACGSRSRSGSQRSNSIASHLSGASDIESESEQSEAASDASSYKTPQARKAIDATLSLGKRSLRGPPTMQRVEDERGSSEDDDDGEEGQDYDEGDEEEKDEPRLLGTGGGGYDMLALLMDAEVALASLEGPPPYEISDRQRVQFAARRAVRSEVAARARLATLGMHHPQAAAALLQLGLQLEEDLGELEPAARAVRRAYLGFRVSLGTRDPQTCEALVQLRRIENRLLTGLEHVHDDDLSMVIEAVEVPLAAAAQQQQREEREAQAMASTRQFLGDEDTGIFSGTNLAERLPTVAEGETGSPFGMTTETLHGYGSSTGDAGGARCCVSIGVRRQILRVAVRSKNERALWNSNAISSDMSGLPKKG